MKFAGEVCPGGGAGWEPHSIESVFEDIFAGGGVPPMHPGSIRDWGVTLEKMGNGGGFSLGLQPSRMCVSTGIWGVQDRDTHPWMERERERVGETRMGVGGRMLREFEGGENGLQGPVGADFRERESKRAVERAKFFTGLKYKDDSSAEERGGRACDHDPSCLSVPTPLLEANEEAERDDDLCVSGSDCDDLSWLVGLGNMFRVNGVRCEIHR